MYSKYSSMTVITNTLGLWISQDSLLGVPNINTPAFRCVIEWDIWPWYRSRSTTIAPLWIDLDMTCFCAGGAFVYNNQASYLQSRISHLSCLDGMFHSCEVVIEQFPFTVHLCVFLRFFLLLVGSHYFPWPIKRGQDGYHWPTESVG